MPRSGGYSRTEHKRRERAALLLQRMHDGDAHAALRLLQRLRALAGIKKNGWSFKVHAMNPARYQKRQGRLQAAAIRAERQRLERQSMNLSAKARQAYRARFGAGGIVHPLRCAARGSASRIGGERRKAAPIVVRGH
jgi:hypothetical protein